MKFANLKSVDGGNATTEKDFEIFKVEAMYWIKKLGMVDWEWFFQWDETEDRANVSYEISDMMAIVTFSKNWTDLEPTPYQVRKCAYHEIQKVFLGTVATYAVNRQISAEALQNIMHRMIRTMENVYFDDDYSRRFKYPKE